MQVLQSLFLFWIAEIINTTSVVFPCDSSIVLDVSSEFVILLYLLKNKLESAESDHCIVVCFFGFVYQMC
jgi:hypothetical protein